MKSLFRYTLSAIAAAALFTGCEGVDLLPEETEDPVVDPTVDSVVGDVDNPDAGYLYMPSLEISINAECEMYNHGTAANAVVASATRSESSSPDVDTFFVEITDDSDNVKYKATYAEFKAEGAEGYALSPGWYTLSVYSHETIPDVEWDTPTYGTSTEFSIKTNETTSVAAQECDMNNIRTSVELSADLVAQFKPDDELEGDDMPLEVELSIGTTAMGYSGTETRSAYFAAQSTSNTLNVSLSGMYNVADAGSEPDYVAITDWKQSIEGVEAGQWRSVSIKVNNYDEGNILFDIVVETWGYDDAIEVKAETLSLVRETQIYDPDGAYVPVIDFTGAVNDTYSVTTADFNTSVGVFSKFLTMNVEPQGGAAISRVTMDFTSGPMKTILSDTEFADQVVEVWPVNEDLTDYITVTEDATSGMINILAMNSGMTSLFMLSGDNRVTVAAYDDAMRVKEASVTIAVDNGIASTLFPTILWDGYSFEDIHYIPDPDLKVVLNVTSPTGITGFVVKITSDVLTPEELTSVGLDQNLDLINPGSYESGLKALGFPIGDEIKGQLSVTFDITTFMPLLEILGDSVNEFKITVTNELGSTSQTVKINCNI